MKKIFTSILLSCTLLLMAYYPVIAKQEDKKNTSSGNFTLNAPLTDEFQVDGVTTSFTVNWKQWVMVGEPVISNHMAWSINTSSGDVIIKDMNDKNVRVRIADVPAKVLQKVFIADLDIDAHIQSPAFKRNDYVYVRLSAGILGKPAINKGINSIVLAGSKDYNLPECPNWDQTFYTLIGKKQKFLSAEQAKEIVKKGFEIYVSGSQVTRMDIYLEPIASWYHDQQSTKQLKQLKARQQQGLAKLKQEQKREQLANRAVPKTDDDFLADLESELSQVDLDNEQQEALQQLQQQHKQELENFSKTSQKYERYLLSLQNNGEKKLGQKKIAVEGRTLPAEELIAFKVNGKWGFKDDKGKIIIAPQYAEAKNFRGKYAIVNPKKYSSYTYGIINRNNQIVMPFKYGKLAILGENQVREEKGSERYRLLNFSGQSILPDIYHDIEKLSPNRVITQLDKKAWDSKRGWAIYDNRGQKIFPKGEKTIFKLRNLGNNRLAIASVEDGFEAMFDYDGNQITPAIYTFIGDISYAYSKKGLNIESEVDKFRFLAIKGNLRDYGVIDETGKIIIPCTYSMIEKFRKDRYVVTNHDGYHGLISVSGKEILPCRYRQTYEFPNE